jgi:two-component system NtrC family sensor kinase
MNTRSIPRNRRILLIDDNESIHHDFRKILSPARSGKAELASAAAELFGPGVDQPVDEGFEIDSAFQGQEGLEKVRLACAEGRPYAMAFVDVRMPPGWDGIETISRIWKEYADLEIVVCTAYSDYSLDQIAGKLGRTDRMLILKKPFDAIEVLQFADALTEKWRLSREARAKVEELEDRVAERTRELREGQQQLIEARKMELVGKLAGGIAHDFNTILTAIIGHADLIQEVAPEGLSHESAAEIGKSALCAAKLTQQLLAFSRKQLLKPERLDMNELICGIEPALRQILGDRIEMCTVANAANPWTRADAGQIREVLTSLVHNARYAMPHGGKLTIETADVTLGAADVPGDAEVKPGGYVMIAVTDTGGGIADEVKRHLFEPYFTTKALGEGKGLGLAVCHGILKQSGGHIAVRSELGKGTTFTVYLPRFQEAGPEEPAAGEAPLSERGMEVILLVEENAALRGMAATVLESQGYTVRRAATGRQAMSIAGRLDRVDLLVADSMMQEMTGKELAEWLCSSRPRMKVLLTSSYEQGKASLRAPDQGVEFLPKPYTPALLSRMTREALDSDPPLLAGAC